jgi:HemY protein
MIRGLFVVVATAALIAVAVFFANHPGHVDIVWRDWEIETSVGVLTALAVLAALLLVLALRLSWLILGGPRAFLRRRRERRQRAGLRALTNGMIAVAAGDAKAAQRHARDADRLLADPALTLLLSADAARLDGDEAAAAKFLTAMLTRTETEFAGLRGLLDLALRTGDRATALRLAERARLLRPALPWVSERLFALEASEGRWEAAQQTLAAAERRGVLPAERARHRRGVVLCELSRAAERRGDRRQAIALAARAQPLVPDLAAVAAHHARLLLQDGRAGTAARAVERAWRTAPGPELALAYGAIYVAETPVARLKSFERLAAQNPTARESHLAAAEAALEARLWGEARRHLDRALAAAPPPLPGGEAAPSGPSVRLCRLRARLEEAEHGDPGQLHDWVERLMTALPDPTYRCRSCGGESPQWLALCPHCDGFDTLSWRTPGPAAPVPPIVLPGLAPRPTALPSAPGPAVDAAAEG